MLINGVDIESLAQEFSYDVNDNVEWVQVQVPDGEGGVKPYRQTFTYVGGKLTNVSAWVAQ